MGLLTACSGSKPASTPTAEPTLIPATATALPLPTATPAPKLELLPGDKIVITKLGISAPLVYRQVGADRIMQSSDSPDEVVIQDFSLYPGTGGIPGIKGNTILSARTGSRDLPCRNGSVPPPCQGVFGNLAPLSSLGDKIEITYRGQTYAYEVDSYKEVPPSGATADNPNGNWDEIFKSTTDQKITLVDSGSVRNPATGNNDVRRVVTAKRTN